LITIGIDPGFGGALAIVGKGRAVAKPMPTLNLTKTKKTLDENQICKLLEKHREITQHIFIEKVSAMPKQGVTSTFNFGAGWGILRGICVGLHIPYTLVLPTTWKRVMCRDMPKGSKDVSIIVAKRLWPDINLLRTPKCRKEDDGMADALCIAEYGRRMLG